MGGETGLAGRLNELIWITEYLDDVEADFLALFRIDDPWSMPAPRFFRLARRMPYYQGSMQYRVTEAQEELDPIRGNVEVRDPGGDSEMRHNAAAAKAAGKGLKDGDQISYVPLSVFMNMAGGDGEYVKA